MPGRFLHLACRLLPWRRGGAALLLAVLLSKAVWGQDLAAVEGRVTSQAGVLPGVQIYLVGTGFGAISDSSGAFVLRAPPATYTIEARFVGFRTQARTITLSSGVVTRADFRLRPTTIFVDNVVVTAIGEEQKKSDIAASIGSIDQSVISRDRPGHPSEIMQRIPGVWVNHTTGEAHMTAIRQPLSTEPIYLYLEDGIPTRSTGFFNQNALYEINIPQANTIEVLRGPGTALYGSDAIGGVVNVTTRPAPDSPSLELSAEGGAFGFARLLASAGTGSQSSGVRLDLNLTRSDGWRDAMDYSRRSGTLRWDHRLPNTQRLKVLLAVSNVDQAPAGSAALSEADYLADPTQNYTPISFREVLAVRLSSEYERAWGRSVLTITPYARYNTMDLLPNWSLSFDPATWEVSNYSLGMVAKHRVDLESMRARIIAGGDLDWSPGKRIETKVDAVRNGNRYVAFTKDEPIYDYDVTFAQASPFVHAAISPLPGLRLTSGLRLDRLEYNYENNLSVVTSGSHRRAASTTRSFTHFSPKLGVTYQFHATANAFAAYNHAFRVPSESQLFRQGSTSATLDLVPVKVNSYEIGLRGRPTTWLQGEISAYLMNKQDDIVTFTDPDGIRISTNAGATRHRGVEIGVGIEPAKNLRIDGALTMTKHTYVEWHPDSGTDLSGNEMEEAPREIGNLSLVIEPLFLERSALTIEWTHLGEYWMDPENTVEYSGHDVFSLHFSVSIGSSISLFGRVINLTDELYAERATYNTFRGDEFAPGLPRAAYVGIRLDLSAS